MLTRSLLLLLAMVSGLSAPQAARAAMPAQATEGARAVTALPAIACRLARQDGNTVRQYFAFRPEPGIPFQPVSRITDDGGFTSGADICRSDRSRE